MSKVRIPYSKQFLEIEIPDKNLVAILESKAHAFKVENTQQEIVNNALDNPIGSAKLEELVKGIQNLVLITSEHTRPVPSKLS